LTNFYLDAANLASPHSIHTFLDHSSFSLSTNNEISSTQPQTNPSHFSLISTFFPRSNSQSELTSAFLLSFSRFTTSIRFNPSKDSIQKLSKSFFKASLSTPSLSPHYSVDQLLILIRSLDFHFNLEFPLNLLFPPSSSFASLSSFLLQIKYLLYKLQRIRLPVELPLISYQSTYTPKPSSNNSSTSPNNWNGLSSASASPNNSMNSPNNLAAFRILFALKAQFLTFLTDVHSFCEETIQLHWNHLLNDMQSSTSFLSIQHAIYLFHTNLCVSLFQTNESSFLLACIHSLFECVARFLSFIDKLTVSFEESLAVSLSNNQIYTKSCAQRIKKRNENRLIFQQHSHYLLNQNDLILLINIRNQFSEYIHFLIESGASLSAPAESVLREKERDKEKDRMKDDRENKKDRERVRIDKEKEKDREDLLRRSNDPIVLSSASIQYFIDRLNFNNCYRS
jgi:hypothetical protein